MKTVDTVDTLDAVLRMARYGTSDWLNITTAGDPTFRRVSEEALVDAYRAADAGGQVAIIVSRTGRMVDLDALKIHNICFDLYGTQASRPSKKPLEPSWWTIVHRERDAVVSTFALGTRAEVEWAIREREFRDVEKLVPINDPALIKSLESREDDVVAGCSVVCIGDLRYYHRGM